MILVVNNYIENVHLGDLDMKGVGELVQTLSGQDFMVKRYYEVSSAFLSDHPEITGVILGGCNSNWDYLYFDVYDGVIDLVQNTEIPVLGICAGHHLMAIAYDGVVRRCDFGKEERFFTEIEVIQQSPLTEGLDEHVYAFEYHYCAVLELPENCERLMKSKKTQTQAFRVKGKHQYGVQFHPELDKEAKDPLFRAETGREPNGQIILKNFLNLCEG